MSKRELLTLGVPELHLDAFKPVAGKMRLYGGGGGKSDNSAAERAAEESRKQQAAYEAQLKSLQASTQMEASKSLDNVVKVEQGGGLGLGATDINFGDTSRKKKSTSNTASSLGIS